MAHNTLGTALYRARKFEEAAAEFTTALKLRAVGATNTAPGLPATAKPDPAAQIVDELFLAMTQHQLGQIVEARNKYDAAVNKLDVRLAEADTQVPPLTWQMRLEMQLFRREAAALFESKARGAED